MKTKIIRRRRPRGRCQTGGREGQMPFSILKEPEKRGLSIGNWEESHQSKTSLLAHEREMLKLTRIPYTLHYHRLGKNPQEKSLTGLLEVTQF